MYSGIPCMYLKGENWKIYTVVLLDETFLFILYFLDEAVKETLRQAFISVDKEYFESIGQY